MALSHVPVLMEEVLAALSPVPGEVYVDATAGLGGHACAVAARLGATGRVVLCDMDAGNLERATAAVQGESRPSSQSLLRPGVIGFNTNFANLPRLVGEAGVRADMFLADLGFASVHVDDAARGFSFMRDGPLDMRMDPRLPTTAADLVASLSERELTRVIEEYGEDRAAGRIARKLVSERARGPIRTTARLAEIVRSAAGGGRGGAVGIDPATRTFQALRIMVNDEMGSLAALLAALEADAKRILRGGEGTFLRKGARVGFITFHSLEDRPVKRLFGELAALGARDLTDGPLTAGETEMSENPRARSAKLRAVGIG